MNEFYSSIMNGLNEAVAIETFRQKMNKLQVPECYFSLFSPKEQAMCVEKRENLWITYICERGNEYDTKEFCTLEEALQFVANYFT